MREDIIKLDKLDQDVRFLAKYHIKTYDELKEKWEEIKENLQLFTEERNRLRTDLKRYLRQNDETAAEDTRKRISYLSEEITKLRSEIKSCDRIEKRSIASIGGKNSQEQANQKREEKSTNLADMSVKSENKLEER